MLKTSNFLYYPTQNGWVVEERKNENNISCDFYKIARYIRWMRPHGLPKEVVDFILKDERFYVVHPLFATYKNGQTIKEYGRFSIKNIPYSFECGVYYEDKKIFDLPKVGREKIELQGNELKIKTKTLYCIKGSTNKVVVATLGEGEKEVGHRVWSTTSQGNLEYIYIAFPWDMSDTLLERTLGDLIFLPKNMEEEFKKVNYFKTYNELPNGVQIIDLPGDKVFIHYPLFGELILPKDFIVVRSDHYFNIPNL